MKRKQITELHHKNVAELKKELIEKRQELTKLRLGKTTTTVKNTRIARIVKDDVARIVTMIHLKELKEPKV